MSKRTLLLVAVIWLAACSAPSLETGNREQPAAHLATATVLDATPTPPATAGEPTTSQRLAKRWIEVLLDEQKVLLHDGDDVVAEYPVSAGVGDTPETTTYPGTYRVQSMWEGPEETVPGVFVTDVIVFDWAHGNGFHSLPADKDGNVLDPTLGKPASAGCVRLAASRELYEFAEIGMKVVIR